MIRVRQIEIDIDHNTKEDLLYKVALKLNIKPSEIQTIKIHKRSLDARKKPHLKFVYELDIEVKKEDRILSKTRKDVFKIPYETYSFSITGKQKMKTRPIIVGAGPAGLFCAYLLASNGYQPLIIERGERVEERVKQVEEFWKTGRLNIHSNVQFGEGGAGTFSDGKLNTLTKDPAHRMKKVFEIFVECGAHEDILYDYKPHIGTDVLRDVVQNMRNKIIQMGGEFRYHTCLTDLKIEKNTIKEIEINKKETLPCETLILAIGHSARDTFEMLYHKKMSMNSKPFAVGIRIQHPQDRINLSQYGVMKHPELSPASYKLTYHTKEGRGVYSFCMCPGGYVVNASSEEGYLAINGMSNRNRESKNANSAIVVSITPKDFGTHPFAGLEFQRKLEKLAYKLGNHSIPIQLYKDFKKDCISSHFGEIEPVLKGTYEFANLNELFPSYLSKSLKEGIEYFGAKIKGYNCDDAILAGVESRTSSPIRINRDEKLSSNIQGIYPCGEGSGYAGGITTAAMDGMKVAEKIAEIYHPLENRLG